MPMDPAITDIFVSVGGTSAWLRFRRLVGGEGGGMVSTWQHASGNELRARRVGRTGAATSRAVRQMSHQGQQPSRSVEVVRCKGARVVLALQQSCICLGGRARASRDGNGACVTRKRPSHRKRRAGSYILLLAGSAQQWRSTR